MAFRLIRNRTQEIAVKGFIVTLVSAFLIPLVVKSLSFDELAPFALVWIMMWIIGSSMNSKSS